MKVIEEINRGGFGRVERVQTDAGDIVARKVYDPLPGILAAGDEAKLRKRFRREVTVQKSLSGRSFVPVLDTDLDCHEPWFTMPLADRNFEEEINRAKMSGEGLTEQLSEILNALEELHALDFTHRDLKPANVLLLDGVWKLSDFGLVMPLVSSTTTLTGTGSAWGSPFYCAPEQVNDFKHATRLVDIYAFGAILHDIYGSGPSGRVPYEQLSCTGPIGPVVERCTAKAPERRFKNVSAVRDALLTILSGPSAPPSSPTGTDWLERMNDLSAWTADSTNDFNRYLSRSASDDDKSAVCMALDEEILEAIHQLDFDLWQTIVLMYCEWAKRGFEFSYCDVIVGRLEVIYSLSNLEGKAAAAIAAANLGANHNRWYVMGRVLSMCSTATEDALAGRIAIEIIADGAQRAFRTCAEHIRRTSGEYHPRIVQVL